MPELSVHILLAEDDLNLGVLLVDYLEAEGFSVKLCRDGEIAWKAFETRAYDLCLLDVMMPKLDGFSVAEKIRSKNKKIPIVFITARALKEDKLKGYDIGADDYILKPFDEEELLWKIRAILRRNADKKNGPDTISLGNYTLDKANQLLLLNGNGKRMTEKECELLCYLALHKNKIIRREDLLTDLWGKNDYFYGRSLDVFITKMRKYLSEDDRLSIESVFKVGFIFNVP